ncbi:MAG: MFS transporter [Pigmentiphaga sp.]|uniref:MFS transporter n=1 Tax=Pigmentiphaga sp. TaxID=1977564 RepID=UPI0029B25DF1|nr:MFS transporter [Pigmentiphaga sp.]MDX3907728.1 MFS transporter [Pigmentiphaga sp.]
MSSHADPRPPQIGGRQSLLIFACFAAAYFFSYGLRSVNAALAPFITEDLSLSKSQLGWLSSAFFISLAAMQAPLGVWLDKYGARRVEAGLLAVAALGSLVMVWAGNFATTSAGRILIGAGVAASLMAPFSYFRRCYAVEKQAQLGLWLLVAGTGGAVFFTSPAAVLASHFGWRSVHLLSGISLAVVAVLLWRVVPDHDVRVLGPAQREDEASLWLLLRHPEILRVLPLSAIGQGGIIALQTLWAGPWMTDVAGMSPARSASLLLVMMVAMMLGYMVMGFASPALQRRFGLLKIALAGYVSCFAVVLLLAAAPATLGWLLWLVMAVAVAPIMVMQPYLSAQFPRAAAGRLVTLYNMFVFVGAFFIQWGIGVVVDRLSEAGMGRPGAYAIAFATLGVLQLASLAWFARRPAAR